MQEAKSIAALVTMFLREGEEVLETGRASGAVTADFDGTKFLGDYVAHRLQPFLTSLQAYPVCTREDHVTIDQAPEVPVVTARASFVPALESYEI